MRIARLHARHGLERKLPVSYTICLIVMTSVYRKTGKGFAEIGTRANRLAPRLRQALIMVDGNRTDDDLAKLILSQPDETLAILLEQGYIELAATPGPMVAASNSGMPSITGAASTTSSSESTDRFKAHRRESVRYVNEHLGPSAEMLAIKLEKATDWAQLRPHLETATEFLLSARGTTTADDFTARFIDTLP
jgi:hypothetical protein